MLQNYWNFDPVCWHFLSKCRFDFFRPNYYRCRSSFCILYRNQKKIFDGKESQNRKWIKTYVHKLRHLCQISFVWLKVQVIFYQLLMFITDIQVVWNILRGWCQGVGSFFTNDGGNRWFASGISNYLTNRRGTIFWNRFCYQSQCLFHVTFFDNCVSKWWYYD